MENNKGIVRFIPNALTVGRFVLTVIFLIMILYAPKIDEEKSANFLLVAFILFVITGLTDIVDGKLARMYDVTSKLGRILDPLADKFLVCGAFICFAIVGQPRLDNFNIAPLTMDILRWATALIIIARELIVTVLRQTAEARGINFAATASGKIKMFLQSFGIGTVMIKWAYVTRIWGDIFTVIAFLLMVILTVISGVRSVQRPRE
jgi:CDP-diacylglycerol---glycerol-3-phosphate 3-phosphatidyltransferase